MPRLTLVVAVALLLRLATAALLYTDDYRNFESGDYALYRIGAAHLRETGDFSNSLFLPRPPLYPAVVALLQGDNRAVLLVNIVVGALIAGAAYWLARRLDAPPSGALIAAWIVAVDPAGLVYSAFLGPEPLANLLLALSVVLLLAATGARPAAGSLLTGAGSGALLALSALTRPATYLLWIVLAGWRLVANRRQWRAIPAFALVSAAGVGGWMLHNAVVFDFLTFSTVGPFTMLYYRAASVERQATGADMETVYLTLNRRVEEALGRDPSDVTAETRYEYHAGTPAVSQALTAVSWEVFRAHPLITLATIPVGFARMYGLVPGVSHFQGIGALLDTLWNYALLLGTVVGLIAAGRRKQWTLFWCILLPLLYYTGGTLLVKSAGLDTRERSMLTPFMAVACAYALHQARARRAARRGVDTRAVVA